MTQPRPTAKEIQEARSVQTKKATAGSYVPTETVNSVALDFIRQFKKSRQDK
jgi:hypothetical protein